MVLEATHAVVKRGRLTTAASRCGNYVQDDDRQRSKLLWQRRNDHSLTNLCVSLLIGHVMDASVNTGHAYASCVSYQPSTVPALTRCLAWMGLVPLRMHVHL